ncbi:hypothetical protein ADICYQ_4618 [Cyclobacterium qasimii M12-11B]|uniref:Uncharacterized protein n=1 Tax=Cyclobacterium qasimii M12-11B TaxID=641524 RepID=S7WIC8_9BACT|nr:hypothetical protein ADICYQ_4618 [Cyclobacterium qasimii M12-11B]
MHKAPWVLLLLSHLTIAGAVTGSHGLFLLNKRLPIAKG